MNRFRIRSGLWQGVVVSGYTGNMKPAVRNRLILASALTTIVLAIAIGLVAGSGNRKPASEEIPVGRVIIDRVVTSTNPDGESGNVSPALFPHFGLRPVLKNVGRGRAMLGPTHHIVCEITQAESGEVFLPAMTGASVAGLELAPGEESQALSFVKGGQEPESNQQYSYVCRLLFEDATGVEREASRAEGTFITSSI